MTHLCGMRLNSAGVIIGWIGAVFSFLGFILCVLALTNADFLADEIVRGNPNLKPDAVHAAIIFSGSFYLAFIVINLVASALLVAGTIKERHLMLIPWLLNSGASLLFNTISFVSFLVKLVQSQTDAGTILFTIFFVGLFFFIQFFIWYIIYALYKSIQSRNEQQQLLSQPVRGYPNYTKI